MEAQKSVTLGGRKFVVTSDDDMTFDQFAWIQTAADKAGLGNELLAMISPIIERAQKDGEAISDDYAEVVTREVVGRCYQDRAHLDVLAGVLVEEGQAWSHDKAKDTREFFGQLKGKADIEIANIILAQAILGFFWSGLASMMTSQNSSALADAAKLMERVEEMEGESGPEEGWASSGS